MFQRKKEREEIRNGVALMNEKERKIEAFSNLIGQQ
jgi:hypothetical protein